MFPFSLFFSCILVVSRPFLPSIILWFYITISVFLLHLSHYYSSPTPCYFNRRRLWLLLKISLPLLASVIFTPVYIFFRIVLSLHIHGKCIRTHVHTWAKHPHCCMILSALILLSSYSSFLPVLTHFFVLFLQRRSSGYHDYHQERG